MSAVTPAQIKELRDRTSAGMSDCKNALVEASGDMEKAVEIILKKGIVKAAARAGKVASEGEVATWTSPDAKRAVIVEVNSQTDFVSRGDDFKAFVKDVLEVAKNAKKGDDIAKQLEEKRAQLSGRIGENIVVRRWDVLESKGFVQSYVHMGGKLAVLVAAEGPNSPEVKTFVENVAMQIAAMNPMVVRRDEVSQTAIDKQKEIFAAQLKEEGKPEAAWPKILEGKIAKWYTEITLLGQDCVWEPGAGAIEKVRSELSKKLGGEIKIEAFVRFGLGEGIEKKSEDLAAEVAKTIGS
jgi:elongation factor Ts